MKPYRASHTNIARQACGSSPPVADLTQQCRKTGTGILCNPDAGTVGGHRTNGRATICFVDPPSSQAPVTTSRSNSDLAGREPVPVARRSLSQLLRALPESDFEALRLHLQSAELVRETVPIEAGAPLTQVYLPESGVISMVVRLSEGQRIELAMVGRDSIAGAAAAFGDAISLSDAGCSAARFGLGSGCRDLSRCCRSMHGFSNPACTA